MNLDDLPNTFATANPGEISPFTEMLNIQSSMDDDFVEYLAAFSKSNKLSAIFISVNRPILAISGETIVSISDRNAFEFELDDLFTTANQSELEAALSDGRSLEVDDLTVTTDNIEIPFKRIYLEKGHLRSFFLCVEGIETSAESFAESKLSDDPFAGKHDGSVYEYEGFMTERVFDELLRFGTEKKASDFTVQPNIPVMARIGSDIVPITKFPINTDEIDKIIRHVSNQSGPAEVLGGAALDPAHEVFIKKMGRIRFRVNITGGRVNGGSSAQISLRSLPTIPIEIGKLDLEPELITASTSPKDGLVLFCGPTGSGKSTTMSSLVRFKVEQPFANIKVIEFSAPIEFIYDGIIMPSSMVFQTTAGQELRDPDHGSDFAYAVKNAMRRNPDWIIIGEARDTDTMQQVLAASQSGHLVLSTMHTTSVANTIRRAVNMFPETVRQQMSLDIMEQLRLICVQRLIPKIGGGRVAVREFMVFGEEIRELFLREKVEKWPQLTRRLFAEERVIGQSMQKAALRLLMTGKITEEVYEFTAATGIGV